MVFVPDRPYQAAHVMVALGRIHGGAVCACWRWVFLALALHLCDWRGEIAEVGSTEGLFSRGDESTGSFLVQRGPSW